MRTSLLNFVATIVVADIIYLLTGSMLLVGVTGLIGGWSDAARKRWLS